MSLPPGLRSFSDVWTGMAHPIRTQPVRLPPAALQPDQVRLADSSIHQNKGAVLKDTGIVTIHGKEYQTVAFRVSKFRELHPSWSLTTEVLYRDFDVVVMKASILDDTGRLVATGHAEEFRADGKINKTSALENAETSAIGRALATLGLGGTEFASADEVARAVSGDKPSSETINARKIAFDILHQKQQDRLRRVAELIKQAASTQDQLDIINKEYLDNDEKAALWYLLDSKTRSALKAMKEAA